jgi:hypothetical protein
MQVRQKSRAMLRLSDGAPAGSGGSLGWLLGRAIALLGWLLGLGWFQRQKQR